jgi:hypothetical protein
VGRRKAERRKEESRRAKTLLAITLVYVTIVMTGGSWIPALIYVPLAAGAPGFCLAMLALLVGPHLVEALAGKRGRDGL